MYYLCDHGSCPCYVYNMTQFAFLPLYFSDSMNNCFKIRAGKKNSGHRRNTLGYICNISMNVSFLVGQNHFSIS